MFHWLGKHIEPDVLKKGGVTFLLQLTGNFVLFITQIVFARLLGAGEFGEYILLINIANLFCIFSIFGFNQARVKLIPQYRAENNKSHIQGLLKRTSQVSLILALVMGPVLAFIIYTFPQEMRNSPFLSLMLTYFYIVIITQVRIDTAGVRGFGSTVKSILPYLIFQPLLSLAILLVVQFLGVPTNSITGLSAYTIAAILVFIISKTFLRAELGSIAQEKPEFETRKWIILGANFLLIAGFYLLMMRIDVIIVGYILGPVEAGRYFVGARIAGFSLIGLNAVNFYLAPKLSSSFTKNNTEKLQRNLTSGARLSTLITGAIALILLVFGPIIVNLFGEGFSSAYPVLIILVLAQLFHAASGSCASLLSMTGGEKVVAFSQLLAAIVNALLSVIFLYLIGLNGAAIATGLTLILWRSGLVYYCRKKYGVNTAVR